MEWKIQIQLRQQELLHGAETWFILCIWLFWYMPRVAANAKTKYFYSLCTFSKFTLSLDNLPNSNFQVDSCQTFYYSKQSGFTYKSRFSSFTFITAASTWADWIQWLWVEKKEGFGSQLPKWTNRSECLKISFTPWDLPDNPCNHRQCLRPNEERQQWRGAPSSVREKVKSELCSWKNSFNRAFWRKSWDIHILKLTWNYLWHNKWVQRSSRKINAGITKGFQSHECI